MKHLSPLLLPVLLFSDASAAAVSLAEMEKGQLDIRLIDSQQSPYIQARGLFDAPVEQVWQTLTDFSGYPQYFQNLTRSEVRSRQGNRAQVYVRFDFPFPINQVWVLNEYLLDSRNKRLSWRMLDGNLKNSDGSGSWTLQPYQGKTLATYRLNVSSGQWLQQQAILRSTPGVFRYLNQKINTRSGR